MYLAPLMFMLLTLLDLLPPSHVISRFGYSPNCINRQGFDAFECLGVLDLFNRITNATASSFTKECIQSVTGPYVEFYTRQSGRLTSRDNHNTIILISTLRSIIFLLELESEGIIANNQVCLPTNNGTVGTYTNEYNATFNGNPCIIKSPVHPDEVIEYPGKNPTYSFIYKRCEKREIQPLHPIRAEEGDTLILVQNSPLDLSSSST